MAKQFEQQTKKIRRTETIPMSASILLRWNEKNITLPTTTNEMECYATHLGLWGESKKF